MARGGDVGTWLFIRLRGHLHCPSRGGTARRAACTHLAMAMPCRCDRCTCVGPLPGLPSRELCRRNLRHELRQMTYAASVHGGLPSWHSLISREREGSPWAPTHCGMSFSYTEDSSTAPAGRASMNRSAATASESASCRTPPCHWKATSKPPIRSSTPRTDRSCSSATPTAAPSSAQPGTHPNVAALVYICAFAPDKDESVNTLIAGFPADGPQPPIPPPAQHTMAERAGATQSEIAASHSVYLSQPEAVATLIAQAAAGTGQR